MNAPASALPADLACSQKRALRRLFLTLFLRGRSARGLNRDAAPKSVGSRLWLSLLMYAFMGFMAIMFLGKPVFALSLYLHAMNIVFLGMLVASAAGEMLFNTQESDILLHRPVAPKNLLWAKIAVLVEVSLWLAAAFNLAGLIIGGYCRNGGWSYPLAHAFSTVLAALFCAGSIVLLYQLCLRWFGRERLNSLMTTAQVLATILLIMGSQLAPQLLGRFSDQVPLSADAWWALLLPPAWFAGLDDALAGSGAASSWIAGSLGVVLTLGVLALSFGKLARQYELGLQALNEAEPARPAQRSASRRLARIAHWPPVCWCVRHPVSRAAFQLAAAYLFRDRDMKLRLYPGLAPMCIFPLLLLWQSTQRQGMGSFGLIMAGAYVSLLPLVAMRLLQYSQQWQAAELFRIAPLAGPGLITLGVQQAVLWLLMLPVIIMLGLAAVFLAGKVSVLTLFLPGLIALPVFSLIPCLDATYAPLSQPVEEAKSAQRGLTMIGMMLVSMALSVVAFYIQQAGSFNLFIALEILISATLYYSLHRRVLLHRWLPQTD